MTTKLTIENLKCGGCANTIKKGVLSIDSVQTIDVNVENSELTIEMSKDVLSLVKEKLSKLGYPQVGDKNTVMHKAKSFVSCAVGRIDK